MSDTAAVICVLYLEAERNHASTFAGETEEKAAFQDAIQSNSDKTMTLDQYEKQHGPV